MRGTRPLAGPCEALTADPRAGRVVVRVAVLVVMVLAALAALGVAVPRTTAAQVTGDVLDLSAVLASGPEVTLDPSGLTATVAVSTSVDLACAIVYGTDDSFGSLATDRDMGGQVHRDHHVVLGGLRPGTRYVFRMQGSGVDGTLYRSPAYDFTTPMASSSIMPALALGAQVVAVSSEFSPAYSAANAVDGDPGTEWSSKGDGDAAFITIDLGRAVDITAVDFRTRQMGDGTAITRTFTVTPDGGTPLGPFPASQAVPVSFTGRVLRFDVDTSTGGNTGASEIVVLGTDATAP